MVTHSANREPAKLRIMLERNLAGRILAFWISNHCNVDMCRRPMVCRSDFGQRFILVSDTIVWQI